MKATIYNIKDSFVDIIPLKAFEQFIFVDYDIDPIEETISELVNIEITCDGIIVNDDRISIEFPDGSIADFEINSDDYDRITII